MTTAQQIGERLRPAAEAFSGMKIIGQDCLAQMNAAEAHDIDGFSTQNWNDFKTLVQTLIAGTSDPTINQAINTLRVRGLDVILHTMTITGNEPDSDPVIRVFKNYIKPLARLIRAWRYRANDTVRICSPLLENYSDEALIDEGRQAEGLAAYPAGLAKALVLLMSEMISDNVNTDNVGNAIDAACEGIPLEVF